MKIGFVGLGKMGGNMVKRFLAGGYQVVGYDPLESFGSDLPKFLKIND